MKFNPMSFFFIFIFVLFLHIFIFEIDFFTRNDAQVSLLKKDSFKVIKLSFIQNQVIHEQKQSLEKGDISPPKKVNKSFPKKIHQEKKQKKQLFVSKQKVKENKKNFQKKKATTVVSSENTLQKIKTHTHKNNITQTQDSDTKEVSLFEQNKILKKYMRYISSTINKNKFYPKIAKRMGIEGECKIALKILASGEIADSYLVQKSSYDAFNKTALEIIKKIGKFKPFPSGLQKKELTIEIPLRYNLKG
jgi:protein TonB